MNYSINNAIKFIGCICMTYLAISCNYLSRQRNETVLSEIGVYYNMWSVDCGYGLQYVILTKDSLYANVLHTRDSALVNINRWHQPHGYVKLYNFVPIGIQWKDMVCFIYRDSIGNIWGKDSIYIYEHGIDYGTDLEWGYERYLFYDPDWTCTFYKETLETLQEEHIVPLNCKSMEDVEKQLCISDSSVFEGVRKMSKSELRTLLWGE